LIIRYFGPPCSVGNNVRAFQTWWKQTGPEVVVFNDTSCCRHYRSRP